MDKRMVAVVAMLSSIAAVAQQPKVVNSQVSVKSGPLAQVVAGVHDPAWVGYTVPVTRALHNDWNDGTAHLEGTKREESYYERKAGEPAPLANVLLRVTDGRVERVQLEETTREIDAGGLPFVWVNGVGAAESVRVLAAAIDAANESTTVQATMLKDGIKATVRSQVRLDSAMVAIAVEDSPEVTAALRRFTDTKYPQKTRERAAFWLANERGREGLDAVTALLKSNDSDAFREQLVFDLTLAKGAEKQAALDALLSVAKSDASIKVRSKAQFWLAQMVTRKMTDDGRVAAALSASAKDDPDAAIRKSAVFALSRLPQPQATTQLIQVASTSKDPSTRREAIFWLGQSKDPQALTYLEKVVRE